MPARVLPTLTEEQSRSVVESTSGIETSSLVRQRCALVHQGRVAAQKVHAHFLCRAVKRLGNRARVALTDQAHRGHGNALVDNRNAQFTLNGFARAHKVFGDAADFIVHALCAGFRGRMRAVQQIDA